MGRRIERQYWNPKLMCIVVAVALLIAGVRACFAGEPEHTELEPKPDPPLTEKQTQKIEKIRADIRASMKTLAGEKRPMSYQSRRQFITRKHVELAKLLAAYSQGEKCMAEIVVLSELPVMLDAESGPFQHVPKRSRKQTLQYRLRINLLELDCAETFVELKRPAWAKRLGLLCERVKFPAQPTLRLAGVFDGVSAQTADEDSKGLALEFYRKALAKGTARWLVLRRIKELEEGN